MTKKEILKVKRIKDVPLPEYVFEGDIGFDLRASESVSLQPYEQKTIKTGLVIEIPKGYVGLIRDRVGIVTKMGVHTAAGTFDPDYRGEVSVVLVNFGDEKAEIEEGMRIAQMIIIPAKRVVIKEVKTLSKTKRLDKGFGSTGMKEIIKELNKITRK